MMYLRYNYRLFPTNYQKTLLEKTFGCNRKIWNYFLQQEIETYKNTQKFLFYNKKATLLIQLKKSEEYKYLKEINSQTLQQTLKHQDLAFKNFLRDKKQGGKQFRFPRFKAKKNKQTITFPQHTEINYESGYTKLCKLGNIPTVFHRKLEGKISSCTITRTPANNYYISFCCQIDKDIPKKPAIEEIKSIGLDLGTKDFLVCSDGTKVSNPKFYTNTQKKLAHHQRNLNRKVKGSKNYEEQRIKVAEVHEEISSKRKDFFFNLIKYISNDSQITTVFVEDLNIKGMQKNHKLAKAISDSSWSSFLGLLDYKLSMNAKNLIKVNRFFASSKTCNNCSSVNKDLELSDRIWICPNCGQKLDRDINAAKNIKEFGVYGTITSKILGMSTLPRNATSGEAKERSAELTASTGVSNDASKSQPRGRLTLGEGDAKARSITSLCL